MRVGGELVQHSAASHFRPRIPRHLAPPQQVVERTLDPGAAPDLPQADQVPCHLSVEQH